MNGVLTTMHVESILPGSSYLTATDFSTLTHLEQPRLAFLLGNWHLQLHRFDTEGVKKTFRELTTNSKKCPFFDHRQPCNSAAELRIFEERTRKTVRHKSGKWLRRNWPFLLGFWIAAGITGIPGKGKKESGKNGIGERAKG